MEIRPVGAKPFMRRGGQTDGWAEYIHDVVYSLFFFSKFYQKP